MGKLNNSVLILGEGPTEFFYLKSLADTFKHITIKPDYPKHTNLQELDFFIQIPMCVSRASEGRFHARNPSFLASRARITAFYARNQTNIVYAVLTISVAVYTNILASSPVDLLNT